MEKTLAVFIALWLVLLTFWAAPPCLASNVTITKLVGNPPLSNNKIAISVSIDPCDTLLYAYKYYYVDEVEGKEVLLEEGATECKDHEMSIT